MNATRQTRRGVTLVEVSVAIVLLGVMAGLIVEAQTVRGRLQRAMHWRELATIEAGNLMEQVTALPWDDLNEEKLATMKLSDGLRQALPKAALHLAVDPVTGTDQPESRRIRLEIDWPGPTGEVVRPVRLTSWVYHIEPKPAQETTSEPGPESTSESLPEAVKEPGEKP
jgi:prepilin-type N-terminal cleavage/methylation domain-containing protein